MVTQFTGLAVPQTRAVPIHPGRGRPSEVRMLDRITGSVVEKDGIDDRRFDWIRHRPDAELAQRGLADLHRVGSPE